MSPDYSILLVALEYQMCDKFYLSGKIKKCYSLKESEMEYFRLTFILAVVSCLNANNLIQHLKKFLIMLQVV